MLTTVNGLQQVRTRLFFGLELVSIYLDHHPAGFFVDEEDVAHDVLRRRAARFPGVTAVESLQQRAFAADDPATLLIEEEDAVKPRHCAGPLSRPCLGGGN